MVGINIMIKENIKL